ncbi:MAG TPA: Tn3 family transposase [Ktedonobacteraceae bacterium]|nr:Tn3 family transposase [Ktedonobacteraceae bacterium]
MKQLGTNRAMLVKPVANEQTLRDLVAEYKAQGEPIGRKCRRWCSSYRNHYRQVLPALLEVLDFRSNNTAYQPAIQALAVVREYASSGLVWYPLSADEFIASLKTQMTSALTSFERFMRTKPKDVVIGTKRGKGWITLSALPAQPEPKHLPRLKTEILRRWGVVGLLDILKEAAMLTGCLDCFQSTGSREALEHELLHKRLLLCLYGMGTNMGLKRMAGVDPRITAEDLRYTRRRYLHKEHLRAAIAQVVNALLHARLEAIWGEATSTCASDSKKFVAVDQNLLTQWHARYRGPGVLVYWHVERRSVCIYSQLKSCTSSEVAAMLEGVLRHCTDMTIKRQMTDSHGQSEIGFAFSHLLGFRLLPRLKPMHSQRLAVVEEGAAELYAST